MAYIVRAITEAEVEAAVAFGARHADGVWPYVRVGADTDTGC